MYSRSPLMHESLLQHCLEHLDNFVANLSCAGRPAEVLGPEVMASLLLVIQHLGNSRFNQLGFLGSSKRVSEHHRCREYGSDGIGDALPSNVRGRPVNAAAGQREIEECVLVNSEASILTARRYQ